MKTSEGNNEGRKSIFIGEISGVPVPPRKENLILFYESFLSLSICFLQDCFHPYPCTNTAPSSPKRFPRKVNFVKVL